MVHGLQGTVWIVRERKTTNGILIYADCQSNVNGPKTTATSVCQGMDTAPDMIDPVAGTCNGTVP
jgi:hypothetical protein